MSSSQSFVAPRESVPSLNIQRKHIVRSDLIEGTALMQSFDSHPSIPRNSVNLVVHSYAKMGTFQQSFLLPTARYFQIFFLMNCCYSPCFQNKLRSQLRKADIREAIVLRCCFVSVAKLVVGKVQAFRSGYGLTFMVPSLGGGWLQLSPYWGRLLNVNLVKCKYFC